MSEEWDIPSSGLAILFWRKLQDNSSLESQLGKAMATKLYLFGLISLLN